MAKIKKIKASQILDSRNKPTIEARVITDSGEFSAAVPSGTSKGEFEAKAGSPQAAIKKIEGIISRNLAGKNPVEQREIDNLLIKLDGTEDKSNLGANAILAVSTAVLRAAAKAEKTPLWQWIAKISGNRPKLPYPCVLQIEGGLHGKGELDIQEFMTIFQAGSFEKSFVQSVKIYHLLKKFLIENYGRPAVALGLEGAFIPPINKTKEVLEVITEISGQAGVNSNDKMKIILDAAASSFVQKGGYFFEGEKMSREELSAFYSEITESYPLIGGIEDPFSENDWPAWKKLTKESEKSKVLIVADDLTATNPKRIKEAHQKKACNAVIIKPNQIGTVSETIESVKLAKSYGWKIIVSHRSGETKDDFIADLAVGSGADFIKTGAPFPKERMVKYNRLLKIEKELCQN
ncbi:MAG TPA: enolase [Patescibacteria group bacterium]|nr:enolase [Patescibacteria group bacterium]